MSEPGYRDRLKSTVVRVARDILATDGLKGLQARRIAKESDCSVGTIYNLFGSLDMVAISANSEALNELHEALQQKHGAASGGLETQLQDLALTYLKFALERQTEWRAIFEHRLTTETNVPAWYREAQGELFRIVEDIIAPAIAEPEARREAARALFAAVHGVIAIALDQKLGDFDAAATERQVRLVTRAIARGLSA